MNRIRPGRGIAALAFLLPILPVSAKADPPATTSHNYMQVISLPRAGDPKLAASPTALEAAVAAHNKVMEANPAPRNRNRIVYLTGPEQYKPVMFPVTAGASIVNGLGKQIGKIAGPARSTPLNFGQRKRIGNTDYVFAFGVPAEGGGAMSAWIPESALKPSPERTEFAREIATDVHNSPDGGDAPERYRLVGDSAEHWKNDRLKVAPRVNGAVNKHECASDYVTRPGNVIYLLTALPGHGGVAGDAFSPGAEFIPSAGVPRAAIPLYLPTDATTEEHHEWETNAVPHQMEFVYGHVGERYGWIPTATLKKIE